jgi:HAD superfamily hydrolase (TIGR01509 family)
MSAVASLPHPTAVIFDMDGVLIDSEPMHSAAMRSLLADHGATLAPDLEATFVGWSDREIFRALKAHYGLAPGEAELASDWIARVVTLLGRPHPPLAGVPDVLHQLRRAGVRLALASSSAPRIIAATLEALGLRGTFEFVVSGHDVASGKPSPDIFLETARRLEVAPGDCLVVEDSVNGLTAALAAGMRCVVVPCAATVGHDFSAAAARLESLTELPAYLAISG